MTAPTDIRWSLKTHQRGWRNEDTLALWQAADAMGFHAIFLKRPSLRHVARNVDDALGDVRPDGAHPGEGDAAGGQVPRRHTHRGGRRVRRARSGHEDRAAAACGVGLATTSTVASGSWGWAGAPVPAGPPASRLPGPSTTLRPGQLILGVELRIAFVGRSQRVAPGFLVRQHAADEDAQGRHLGNLGRCRT